MDVTPEISASPKNDIASANSTALRYGSSIMILQNEGSKGDFQITGSTETLFRIPITIWDESRFVLRAWALSISALAFLLLLSLADGRLAIIEVSAIHTEVLGYFTNCQRHTCPKLDKVTVSKHLGMGFMILALATETFCLFFMGFSFRPIFRRINRCDLVFGILNYTTGTLCLINYWHTFRVPTSPSKPGSMIALQGSSSSYSHNVMKKLRVGRRRTTFQITPHLS
ncbi:uncharacterized protein LOC110220016 isoform X2 [Phascolarctos cinereus]|uniref:Uncharacterized protein LOC110220016 isoform X2 n=1 Tax=Phascolarctos cinereus TaxID=38626 RepID=A0A6P5LM87_PHACI|nr:uncharacterized protein LOC110220016 isoform X2 [Phascolarctos cinereus]